MSSSAMHVPTIKILWGFILAPLQGFLRIDVHDKLFAEAHIGILNYHVNILLIEACYRGHVEYNLNLLKVYIITEIHEY